QTEVGRRYETSESQLTILGNTLTEVARTLGDSLVPFLLAAADAMVPVLDALRGLVEWFGNLDPRVQQTIVVGSAVAAALGPMFMAIGSLAGVVKNLLPLLRMVPGAFR